MRRYNEDIFDGQRYYLSCIVAIAGRDEMMTAYASSIPIDKETSRNKE